MDIASLARLLILGAIWGGSFVFMRICVPVLGPTLLVEARLGFGALFLLAVGAVLGKHLHIRKHWRTYLLLGFFNSALPFLLFAYAANTLPTAALAILNAMAPIWGGLITALRERAAPSAMPLAGMLLAISGVILLANSGDVSMMPGATSAVLAGLGAALSYAIAGVLAGTRKSVDPYANAHGSMWAATLLVAPALPFFPAHSSPDAHVVAAALALGVVCSGIAYLLYFRLIADLGPTSALTVTFLIPVFGVLWGVLFLDERPGWHTLAGCVSVLLGTALVTGLFKNRSRPSERVG